MMRGDEEMHVDVSRRIGGVRLLLKKSSPGPMNEEDMETQEGHES
jgi:hypothetical protein